MTHYPTILIVDDHPLVRSALKSVLETADWVRHVLEAENGKQALAVLQDQLLDLVVLDINMPCMNGIACFQEIKKIKPKVKVAVFTQHDTPAYFKKFKALGADGYLLKGIATSEILTSIHHILFEDQQVFSDQATNKLTQISKTLTDRELEILILLCEERQTQEIAGLLHISFHTVNNHRIAISRKTGTDNPIGLTKWAVSNGLIAI